MSAALPVLTLLATAAVAGEEPGGLTLHADRVVVDGARVAGEGHVRAVLYGGELSAARFEVGTDGHGLVVEDGCWAGEAGRACFARLSVEDDGGIALDGARVTPCGCEAGEPPWEIGARRVRVEPERRIVFVGGALRVGGCPVLPLPAGGLPLGARRSGLLAPELGWTRDGVEAGLPLFLTLGPAADLTLTPLWRQERGPRLADELRWALPHGGGGAQRGALGWDEAVGRWRGIADFEHGFVDRDLRTAARGSLVSDPAYAADYAPDFASRQLGFHETRGLVGFGPWRLEHDGFQDPAGAVQRLAGLSWVRPAADATALSPRLAAGVELGGEGTSQLDLDRTWLLARGAAGLAAGRRFGPAEGDLDLSAGGVALRPLAAADRPAFYGQALAEGRLTLPLWGDHGPWRHLLRLGFLAGGALQSPTPPDDSADLWRVERPAWWAGPGVESRWLALAGVPVHLRASAPWSADGFAPEIAAWWRRGPWWGRLQARATWQPGDRPAGGLAQAEAGRGDEAFDLSLGVLALQDAPVADLLGARVAWTLPWGRDGWRPWGRVRLSLADGRLVEEELGLAFTSRCGCLGVELAAAWAEDLDWPGLRLGVTTGKGR